MQEFHNVSRTGKTRVWRIGVKGPMVVVEYGDLGGKIQRTEDIKSPKNVGKKNEISAEQVAVNEMNRLIKKKMRGGYRPPGEGAETEIDWTRPLPENLRFYKPNNTLPAKLAKLLEAKRAWLLRKRDGEMMVACFDINGNVTLYSRNMLTAHHLELDTGWTWNMRFEHLVESLESLHLCQTILLGELVANWAVDDRWKIASYMKTLTPESMERQNKKDPPWFCAWDVAYISGEAVGKTWNFTRKWQALQDLSLSKRPYLCYPEVMTAGEIEDGLSSYWDNRYDDEWSADYDKMEEDGSVASMARLYAKISDWEGFVVIDPDTPYGEKAYNFRGKTDRPAACGKLKPRYEDDFIARFNPDKGWGKWGTGKHTNKVGSLSLYQFNSDYEEVYISFVGTGMDDEFREKFTDPNLYPIVVEVEYASRTYTSKGDKTNSLFHPRVVRVRHDKMYDECVNEEL